MKNANKESTNTNSPPCTLLKQLLMTCGQLKAVISQQYKIQKFNDQRSGFFNLKQGLNLTILLTTQKVCCYVFTYKGKVLTIKAAYNS